MHLILKRFDKLRSCLPPNKIDDKTHINGLLFAVRDLDKCFHVRADPKETLEDVKRQLTWAMERLGAGGKRGDPPTDPANHFKQPQSSAYFKDRAVKRGGTTKRNQQYGSNVGPDSKTTAIAWIICFVCGHQGCWSRNHTKEQRVAVVPRHPKMKSKLTTANANNTIGGDIDSNGDSSFNDALERLEYQESFENDTNESADKSASFAHLASSILMKEDVSEHYVKTCANSAFLYTVNK